MPAESISVETLHRLADAAEACPKGQEVQLTPVGCGLLYFARSSQGMVELRLLAQKSRILLTFRPENLRHESCTAEYLKQGIEFVGRHVANDLRFAKTFIERFSELTEAEIAEPGGAGPVLPIEKQDLGFAENPALPEIFGLMRELAKFEDQQGDVTNLDLSGSVRSIVMQYNIGDLQLSSLQKVSGEKARQPGVRRKGRGQGLLAKNLFRTSADHISVGTLERRIAEWIANEPQEWQQQHDAVYFLQEVSNVKRPNFLLGKE